MKRDFYQKLVSWKHSNYRKPLVVRGARQVGKTYLLKVFGQLEFEQMIYVNFEESPQLKKFFDNDLDPHRILQDICIYFNKTIHHPVSTLIFFDEIQACPNALTSLKYFQEKASDYFVVSAGSLLGVKLARTQGFPVGKVNFLTLYPCHFFEFLEAMGQEKLRFFLENIVHVEPISEPIHEQLIQWLRYYYFVGGMPEAIVRFSQERDLNAVRKIVHQDILKSYLLDFSKYADLHDIMKITAIWQSIPGQLAKENKKFIFSAVQKTARAREYEHAIQWLDDAGLIYRSYHVETPKLPLDSYSNRSCFKVFLLDVGLLSTLSQLPAKAILEGDALFSEFKGALVENYVAQALKANLEGELYYWATQGQAEIDFLVPHEENIIPLEVKSGTSTKQKSLAVYRKKYSPIIAARTSLLNLRQDHHLCNYPLYLINRFPNLFPLGSVNT